MTHSKLTALKITKLTKPGMYGDGAGLWLQVRSPERRSWILRFERFGKVRAMGLGPLSDVTLADARDQAAKYRRMLLDGVDPIEARKSTKAQARVDMLKSITFQQAAEIYIEAHRPAWRNDKHAEQWVSTLKTYAYPVFGDVPVTLIDVTLVLKAIEPIWNTKTETASRLRGRIEAVLDWAKSRGYRTGENPAAWRGHLKNLLPTRAKAKRTVHHPALPYTEIGAFMASLRAQDGVAARALEFTILTAARTKEAIGAAPGEFDGPASTWTVPAERMKAGKAHRSPLSSAAGVIVQARLAEGGDYLFPGRDGPISNMAMLKVLERMGRPDITVHGFRSTFRDWAAEQTNVPNEVAEMALAHTVGDKVEAAYRRGDLFEKRRKLMEAWAAYCDAPATDSKVISIQRAKR